MLQRLADDPVLVAGAVEESLRLEPAASVVDRYATVEASIGSSEVRAGQLVRVSLTAAGRDPAVFDEPDRFVVDRPDARLHLAFAAGPHLCVGLLAARLQTAALLDTLLANHDGLRLDADAPAPEGLVFRKPERVPVGWA